MNIESVITMGADIGFNVFIMLSGTIENLRKQGLNRLKEDIEYSEASNVHWKFLDKVNKETDISSLLIHQKEARIVTVCLKNVTRLKDLKKWLIDNTSEIAKRNMKILFIDDEADQASLNTKKMNGQDDEFDRSKINQLIIDIVNHNKFGSMNYISYTATPYGNFLNEKGKESLYPQNFIISLPKSRQYIGASEIFGNRDNIEDGLEIKNEIKENELEEISEGYVPESLKDALCWFICTVAVQRYRKKVKPVSMLIHTDNKTAEHTIMNKIVTNWLIENQKNLFDRCKNIYIKQTKMFTKEKFFKIMKDYNADGKHEVLDYPNFEEIENELNIILNNKVSHIGISEEGNLEYHKGIHVVVDNSNNKKGIDENGDFIRLAYPKESEFASAMVVIGGNTLARGLTLDGLTTSYFARKVPQVDTLMQMGRWFGYRTGYELLPRIWITDETLEKFEDIAYIEHRLREDLKTYDLGIKPSEYAPKIQTSYLTRFLLTSKNKSQGAKKVGAIYEKVKSQTVIFEKNVDVQKRNLNIMKEFIKFLFENKHNEENNVDTNYVFRKIDFDEIKDLVFKKIKFYENDRFFSNINEFILWIEETKKDWQWDIIVENSKAESDKFEIINGNKIHKVFRSKRNRDEVIDIGILRNEKDEQNAYYYENGYCGDFEKIKRPKLYIYIIDKDSKARKNSSRKDLSFETDIVGINMYVPNINKIDKDRNILSLTQ